MAFGSGSFGSSRTIITGRSASSSAPTTTPRMMLKKAPRITSVQLGPWRLRSILLLMGKVYFLPLPDAGGVLDAELLVEGAAGVEAGLDSGDFVSPPVFFL